MKSKIFFTTLQQLVVASAESVFIFHCHYPVSRTVPLGVSQSEQATRIPPLQLTARKPVPALLPDIIDVNQLSRMAPAWLEKEPAEET